MWKPTASVRKPSIEALSYPSDSFSRPSSLLTLTTNHQITLKVVLFEVAGFCSSYQCAPEYLSSAALFHCGPRFFEDLLALLLDHQLPFSVLVHYWFGDSVRDRTNVACLEGACHYSCLPIPWLPYCPYLHNDSFLLGLFLCRGVLLHLNWIKAKTRYNTSQSSDPLTLAKKTWHL